jgi:NTP pyrophosphatase (non-canonical NTP hydrolase)
MELNEYQKLTNNTALYHKNILDFINNPPVAPTAAIVDILEFSYVTMGLVGEAGEIANKVKKIIRDKKCCVSQSDIDDLTKELGDVLWYVSELASQLGKSLSTVAKGNIDKLSKRKEAGTLQGNGDDR